MELSGQRFLKVEVEVAKQRGLVEMSAHGSISGSLLLRSFAGIAFGRFSLSEVKGDKRGLEQAALSPLLLRPGWSAVGKILPNG